jgi:tetratricopeptide (TPR) repeat protein
MPDSIKADLDAAYAARTEGRVEESLLGYAAVADTARASGDLPNLSHALRHVSEIARQIGDPDRALMAGLEAVSACRTMAAPALEFANALRVAALALEASGQDRDAIPLWQEARGRYQEASVIAGVEECDAHLRRGSVATRT